MNTRGKRPVITCVGPAFLQSRASSLDIIIYDKNNDHECNLDDTSTNMIQCSADDEFGSADDELGSADDELGSADDELGSADNELGCADDEFGCADDEFGCADDELGSADNELDSADDELGLSRVLGKLAVVLTQTREAIWQTHLFGRWRNKTNYVGRTITSLLNRQTTADIWRLYEQSLNIVGAHTSCCHLANVVSIA